MSGLSSGTSKKGEEAFLKISALHGQFDERYALGRGGAVGVGDHSRYAILVTCGDEIAEADAEPVAQVGRREPAAGGPIRAYAPLRHLLHPVPDATPRPP